MAALFVCGRFVAEISESHAEFPTYTITRKSKTWRKSGKLGAAYLIGTLDLTVGAEESVAWSRPWCQLKTGIEKYGLPS